jgi:hypothetical protein
VKLIFWTIGGWFTLIYVAVGVAVVGVGLSAYSAVEQHNAAENAASVDNATAAYNAKYDESLAAQLDGDTQANITTERQDDAVYMSREAASYASAGVLATTGSALHAQITNAGHFEKEIQQKWVNANQQEQSYASQARAGLAYGAAQADSDRMTGSIALVNGGAKIASQVGSDYESGVFSFGGGGNSGIPSTDQLASNLVVT